MLLLFLSLLALSFHLRATALRRADVSPLVKVYHEQLFVDHAIGADRVGFLSRSHAAKAQMENTTEALPFIGCGPFSSDKELEFQSLLGENRVHVARDLGSKPSSESEVCFLVHASSENIFEMAR